MANSEKPHIFSHIIGANRLVKTSYKHTRHTTLQPISQSSEMFFYDFQKEIESANSLFFHDLTESTNKLNNMLFGMRNKRKTIIKDKIADIDQIKKEIQGINKSRTSKARLSL